MRSRFVPRLALASRVECMASIGAHALPAKYNGVTVSRGSREQPRPSACRSARSWAMPRDRSASYSRWAARPSQNAAPIIRTATTADQADTAGGGGQQPVGFRCRWVDSKPSVSSKLRNIFHAPNVRGQDPCPVLDHANKAIDPRSQSINSLSCLRNSHDIGIWSFRQRSDAGAHAKLK
jgi:hypothetical protein